MVVIARRSLLAAAAGALLLETAAGRTIVRAATAADPLGPWAAAPASRHPDWRVRAASWAVLAPNPHNRQPWLFELPADGSVVLRCDLDRRLPATDPRDRQITIGLGCAVELFRLAAAAEGIALAVNPFPEGAPQGRLDGRPVARLARIAAVVAPDPLLAHALARRSAKVPFDTSRPIGARALAGLAVAAGGICRTTEDPALVTPLRDLVWRAWMVELETPAAHGETVALMRLGSAAVAASPDGISVYGPGVDPLVAQGIVTRESFLAPGGAGHDVMVSRYRPMLAATAAYVWTESAGDDAPAALAAGMQWLRLNLATTAAGLALHPVSQALQEYPEMAASYAELHALLGVRGGRIQMLGRLGHLPADARAPGPTPRWPAESRIVAR
jgi:hypothetical protein